MTDTSDPAPENSHGASSESDAAPHPALDAHGKPIEANHTHTKTRAGLMLAALGVVFGDIGTSPLYSMQTIFSINNHAVAPTSEDVYGVISLVFWSITFIVSFKYVTLVMRADNDGEGGILALTALLRRAFKGTRGFLPVTLLGIVGAALFYGDSIITPAISVMSAVEGLAIVNPAAEQLVVPVAVVILIVLFSVQRYGTGAVGKAFGPVMVLWFLTLAALGVPQIVAHPSIVTAISPHHAFLFALHSPLVAFIALGAAVLTITGAEALYADMGHFGPSPIRRSWFFVVFPCLVLNYLGQGALIINDPAAVDNPFFRLVPSSLLLPIVILATLATVIASQAVISGAFSVSQQALNLGLLPRISIRHTSKEEGGQIYVPTINTALAIGVAVLVIGFGSSAALANAYGLAVTGTELLATILFGGLAHRVWKWSLPKLLPVIAIILSLELAYFSANVMKIPRGGWLPIAIATAIVLLMTTWMWGSRLVAARRAELEMPLDAFLEKANLAEIPRVPGQAIYLHHSQETVPLALKENVRFNHVLHEQVVIVTVKVLNVPHVHHAKRVEITDIGTPEDGLVAILIKLGFNDSLNVPHNLHWSSGHSELFSYESASARYFLSVLDVHANGEVKGLGRWRRKFFMLLTRNAGSRVELFRLPPNRTVVLGGSIYI